MSYRPATKAEVGNTWYDVESQTYYVLDGILGLHVDDFIGGGECLHTVEDLKAYAAEATFLYRVQALAKAYRFGKWDFGGEFVFCGLEVAQNPACTDITVKTEAYIHKVKPITVEKSRRQNPTDECDAREISKLRMVRCSGQPRSVWCTRLRLCRWRRRRSRTRRCRPC